MRGWANRKEHFPANREEVKEGLDSSDVLDLAIFILLRVQVRSLEELLAPGDLFFALNALQKLIKGLSLLLLLSVSHDLNNNSILL